MIKIRNFEPPDAEMVSAIIRETMKVSNSRDYSLEILQPLIEYFSPEKVLQLNQERLCFVAEFEGQIVGTAAIEDSELLTFFVCPDFQNRGIGARLLKAIEEAAQSQAISRIKVESILTGVSFYEKSGYRKTGLEKETTVGRQIYMEKDLSE
ncbi:MAG: GNAT family N-acetyltransferase [Pyrinomonadaceae bacterium]